MAISRQREYLADATGAMTTRDSDGMASALEKLKVHGRPMQKQQTATAQLFISNPLRPGFIANLFSSHPPLEDRINRLKENASKF
jgi:heat shock protein HtpX